MSIPTSETHYLDSYSSSRSILSLKDIPGETNRTVLLIGLDTGRRSPLRSAPPTPLTFSRMLPSQTSSLPSRTTSTTGLVLISHTAPTSPPGGETPFGDAEAESAEWTQFVQDYAQGKWDGTRTPAPPAAIQRLAAGAAERSELHLCEHAEPVPVHLQSSQNDNDADSSSPASSIASSGQSSSTSKGESPADLLEFYRRHGHMPGPKGEFEDERLRMIKRYGIDQPRRRAAVEAICSIAKSHFRTSTVIVSLCVFVPGVASERSLI